MLTVSLVGKKFSCSIQLQISTEKEGGGLELALKAGEKCNNRPQSISNINAALNITVQNGCSNSATKCKEMLMFLQEQALPKTMNIMKIHMVNREMKNVQMRDDTRLFSCMKQKKRERERGRERSFSTDRVLSSRGYSSDTEETSRGHQSSKTSIENLSRMDILATPRMARHKLKNAALLRNRRHREASKERTISIEKDTKQTKSPTIEIRLKESDKSKNITVEKVETEYEGLVYEAGSESSLSDSTKIDVDKTSVKIQSLKTTENIEKESKESEFSYEKENKLTESDMSVDSLECLDIDDDERKKKKKKKKRPPPKSEETLSQADRKSRPSKTSVVPPLVFPIDSDDSSTELISDTSCSKEQDKLRRDCAEMDSTSSLSLDNKNPLMSNDEHDKKDVKTKTNSNSSQEKLDLNLNIENEQNHETNLKSESNTNSIDTTMNTKPEQKDLHINITSTSVSNKQPTLASNCMNSEQSIVNEVSTELKNTAKEFVQTVLSSALKKLEERRIIFREEFCESSRVDHVVNNSESITTAASNENYESIARIDIDKYHSSSSRKDKNATKKSTNNFDNIKEDESEVNGESCNDVMTQMKSSLCTPKSTQTLPTEDNVNIKKVENGSAKSAETSTKGMDEKNPEKDSNEQQLQQELSGDTKKNEDFSIRMSDSHGNLPTHTTNTASRALYQNMYYVTNQSSHAMVSPDIASSHCQDSVPSDMLSRSHGSGAFPIASSSHDFATPSMPSSSQHYVSPNLTSSRSQGFVTPNMSSSSQHYVTSDMSRSHQAVMPDMNSRNHYLVTPHTSHMITSGNAIPYSQHLVMLEMSSRFNQFVMPQPHHRFVTSSTPLSSHDVVMPNTPLQGHHMITQQIPLHSHAFVTQNMPPRSHTFVTQNIPPHSPALISPTLPSHGHAMSHDYSFITPHLPSHHYHTVPPSLPPNSHALDARTHSDSLVTKETLPPHSHATITQETSSRSHAIDESRARSSQPYSEGKDFKAPCHEVSDRRRDPQLQVSVQQKEEQLRDQEKEEKSKNAKLQNVQNIQMGVKRGKAKKNEQTSITPEIKDDDTQLIEEFCRKLPFNSQTVSSKINESKDEIPTSGYCFFVIGPQENTDDKTYTQTDTAPQSSEQKDGPLLAQSVETIRRRRKSSMYRRSMSHQNERKKWQTTDPVMKVNHRGHSLDSKSKAVRANKCVSCPVLSEEDIVLEGIESHHQDICNSLSQRTWIALRIHELWKAKKYVEALQTCMELTGMKKAEASDDQKSLTGSMLALHMATNKDIVLFLNMLQQLPIGSSSWTLDMCNLVLPELKLFISTRIHTSHVDMTCGILQTIVKKVSGAVLKAQTGNKPKSEAVKTCVSHIKDIKEKVTQVLMARRPKMYATITTEDPIALKPVLRELLTAIQTLLNIYIE